MMDQLEKLKYPIGRFECPLIISPSQISEWIEEFGQFPQKLIDTARYLSDKDLGHTYRPGGWTIRQVIHHLADSHINAYTRFHLTLTEEKPVIRPYFEDRWAELHDGKKADIEVSLDILKAIHARLAALLKSLELSHFERTYIHPEAQSEFTMFYLLGNYTWHGRHHLAHIRLALGNTDD